MLEPVDNSQALVVTGEDLGVELLPPDRIRVEAALSRYPMHRLSKVGPITISLARPDAAAGEFEKWKVTYNSEFGQPGPLAYRVDTLIINRRIDESRRRLSEDAGREVPKLIRLGSLNQICRELGLSQGKALVNVKRAIEQNVGATISFKGRYKDSEGNWTPLTGVGARYSAFFVGDQLTDGRVADCVYIELNDWYRSFLGDVSFRPQDYTYLKALSRRPITQRFYELLSFAMFGALRYDRPRVKMLYSDFCARAPQERGEDFDYVKKQMYKVHLPHMRSGYITKVEYNSTVDAKGKADWEMLYTPGPKARSEYLYFTNPQKALAPALPLLPAETPRRSRLKQLALELPDTPHPMLKELTTRGVSETKAHELLANLRPGQEVAEQLEWFDHRVAKAKEGSIKNAPGLLIRILEENAAPPASFPSSRKLRDAQQARQAKEAERARAEKMKQDYEAYQDAQADAHLAALPADEYQQRLNASCVMMRRSLKHSTDEEITRYAHTNLRSEVKKSGKVSALGFEEWSRQRRT